MHSNNKDRFTYEYLENYSQADKNGKYAYAFGRISCYENLQCIVTS